jgi:hypothetical protein
MPPLHMGSWVTLVAPRLQAGILGFPGRAPHTRRSCVVNLGSCSGRTLDRPTLPKKTKINDVIPSEVREARNPCSISNPKPLGFPHKNKNLSSRAQRATCFFLPHHYRLGTPDFLLAPLPLRPLCPTSAPPALKFPCLSPRPNPIAFPYRTLYPPLVIP